MNKLKRSRGIKILAFLLIVLFIYGALGNAAFLYVAFKNNMMNVEKAAFEQKIYSYFAEKTANDAIHYFNVQQNLEEARNNDDSNDPDNSAYFESEAELYGSKFSKAHSNAAFVIKDDNNNVLLKNYELKDFDYRYERAFTYTDRNDVPSPQWFGAYDTDKGERRDEQWEEALTTALAEDTPTEMPEVTETEPVTVPETSTVENESANMSTTPVSLPASSEREQPTVPPTQMGVEDTTFANETGYNMQYYMGSEARERDGTVFLYVFQKSAGIDESILLFCEDDFNAEYGGEYETLYGNGYAVYFQDEYASSVNGIVYRLPSESRGELRGLYEWVYVRKAKEKQYTVTVYISKTLSAKDQYRFAATISDFAYSYKNAAIPVTVLMVLLGIALYLYLLYAAGWTKDADGPVCRGWHRVPFDLYILIFAALALMMFAMLTDAFSGGERVAACLILLPLAGILFLCFTESLAVRIKTHSIKESLLIRKLFRLLIKCGSVISNNLNVLWKAGIYYVVSGFVTCLLIVIFHHEAVFLLILYVLFKLIELPLLVISILNFHTLQKGAKDLADGTATKPVGGPLLFGEFKKHAANLNRISYGINWAVEERLKSERMKTELITNVSHDLKTPLTSIVNYVDLLKKEEIQNPKAKEYVDVIDRQAQRLKKLTSDIVDASKASTGSIPMKQEAIDFGVLLQQVLGEYENKMAASQLEPVLSLTEDSTVILADGKYLWRVFDNLMNNICKYAMPGTRVYLTLLNDNDAATVIFRNISCSALNISPEELTERFVRGDASRNTDGSGLGLSISKSLTENMGGTLEIEIDGDLFKVTLQFPRSAPPTTQEN